MKSFIVIMAFFAVCSSAFAETYICGPFGNSAGFVVGGPDTYAVQSDDPSKSATLQIKNNATGLLSYSMEKLPDDGDFGVFRAQGVTARIFGDYVSISKLIARNVLSAQCVPVSTFQSWITPTR